jgi:hypothetical protein
MTIHPVLTKEQEQVFLEFPSKFYKNNKYWIRPLDKDVESVFDIKKNSVAQADNFMRWLLFNENSEITGCIAAFVNPKTVLKNNDYPVGGMGFFECINNQKSADLLFDTAKNWLLEKGMEAMEGPINFGERDKFWGLLTRGFDHEPNYLANYHPEYYQQLFENYGFKLYFNQFTFSRPIALDFTHIDFEKGNSILNNPDYYFTDLKKSQIDKFTEDFRIIYNKAWVKHTGVTEMKASQAQKIMKQLKPVIEDNTSFFGYYKGEPIAFFTTIPEVNQIFKHINGKLNLWRKLVFLFYKLLKINKKLLGVGFGVIPEFDGKGVTHALIFFSGKKILENTNYKTIEMHGIGDFNPGMLKFVDKMGKSEKTKIHTTYRYVFNRNRPYERMPLKTNKNE